jgi:alpha-1,2-mannosyltransferase
MSNTLNPPRIESIQHETRPHVMGLGAFFEGREFWTIRLFFILGCLFSIAPILNSVLCKDDNKDYSHWYLIGRSVLAGESLYGDVRGGEPEYMYPPTAAVLFYAPLSNLNHVLFVVVLCALTSTSWAVCIWAANVLVSGKWSGQSRLCAIWPGLAVAPYVWDIQLLGQTNLLLLALTLCAFLMLRNRRLVAAGWLLGTAVAMKAFPLSAIAYFIVRRNWTAVFATIISIIGLVWFFPGVVRGFERNTSELKRWTSLMILDQSGETMSGRSSIGFTRRNQSLVSVSHRLLRPINAGDNPKAPLYVNFANVSPRTAQCIGHGVCFLLGLVLLLACRFRFAPSRECEGLEIAMVCTLVPLCSPLAWTYFFCWLLPGWTALGFWWDNHHLAAKPQRVVRIAAVVTAAILASAISEQIDPTLQAYGTTAWGSVMLFLTLAYIRFNLRNVDSFHSRALSGNEPLRSAVSQLQLG